MTVGDVTFAGHSPCASKWPVPCPVGYAYVARMTSAVKVEPTQKPPGMRKTRRCGGRRRRPGACRRAGGFCRVRCTDLFHRVLHGLYGSIAAGWGAAGVALILLTDVEIDAIAIIPEYDEHTARGRKGAARRADDSAVSRSSTAKESAAVRTSVTYSISCDRLRAERGYAQRLRLWLA